MRLPMTGHQSESLRVPGNDCDGIQRSLARDNPRPQRITYEDIARLIAGGPAGIGWVAKRQDDSHSALDCRYADGAPGGSGIVRGPAIGFPPGMD
jgi:hypothetical protein